MVPYPPYKNASIILTSDWTLNIMDHRFPFNTQYVTALTAFPAHCFTDDDHYIDKTVSAAVPCCPANLPPSGRVYFLLFFPGHSADSYY